MKGTAALVVTGLALAAVGCAGGDDETTTARAEKPAQGRLQPKLVETTTVEGGPRRERAVLQRVVRGLEKSTLSRIEIRPLDARDKAENGAAVAITFTSERRPSVRGQWDEWIVAGAFSRRLDDAGLPAEVDAGGGHGSFTARPKVPRQPDPRPLSRRKQAAVLTGIRAAARRSGGKVVRLEVHRPYGVAVALSLSAKDPAAFLKNKLRRLIDDLIVHRPQLEGIYLGVLDERGRLAMEWGSWTRNPAGSYWVRGDLANCSPIRQSEPPGAKPPPPCPAKPAG